MRKRLLLLLGTVLLCLGIMPASAYAAEPEGYEASTDWVTGTTTYTVTSLEDIYNSSLQPEGDAILDFTECDPLSLDKSESLIISPQKEGAHVTIRGAEDKSYGNVTLKVYGSVAGVTLQDFQTRSSLVNYGGEGVCKIVYDGNCVINLQLGGADYNVCAADDASHLDLEFALQDEKGSVTFSGNLSVERSLKAATMTIRDAFVSFGEAYLGSAIVSPQLTIENSTINGVGHINSFEYPSYETVTIDAFDGSFIRIDDSQISFDADVGGNGSATVLGNSEVITIRDSVVSGIEATDGYGCLGGIFERVTIEGSEVYAKSDHDAAIGPNDSAYGQSGFSKFGITSPSITIEDSVVEAASTYGAAIGMPRLNGWALGYRRPQLGVTISGSSDVTATSVRSAAIGASSSKAQSDVGGVEIEVGAGDITWGRSSELSPLSMLLDLMGLSGESSLEGSLATAAELLSGCTVTIKDSPTIRAKSGVMAIYADSVTVTGTNLVQDTMVIADDGNTYSIYPMETPGAVKIGSETTIGELGYGYASVAATGVSAQSNAAMTFGGASLTDAENGEKQFSVSANGIHSFFTTPTLALSGSVSITGATDGVATVGTKLGLDLNELVPSRAAANTTDCLTFQWYCDGSEISSATSSSYALTSADGGKVITCVVTGRDFFEGSVTSDAVLVGSQTTVPAPTLASRTKNSITLANAGENYEYRIVGNGSWQKTPEFTSLDSGATYVFQQKDPSGNVSAPASFSTLSKTPAADDFTIDYVNETLSFPSGVYLYSDSKCTYCLNKNSSKTSISISKFIDPSGATLYARSATAYPTDTESVTQVTIPKRPDAPTLTGEAITVTSDSVSFVGTKGVAYRLLAGGRVLKTATGDGQATITFGSLSPATKYSIEIRVEASNETSTFRSAVAEQSVTTKSAEPIAPTLYVQAKPEGAGYESVRVGFSWDHPAANGATIDGYAVYAQEGEGELFLVCEADADATSCEVVTGESGVELKPGETYTFTLQVNWSAGEESGEVTSKGVQATLPSLSPNPDDFTIDYVDETLTVPEGVNLYNDENCTNQIAVANNKLSITKFISDYGKEPQSLYARYASAGNDADAVTEIPIPARTNVATVHESDMTLTHNSLSLRKKYLELDTYDYELRLGSDAIGLASDNGSYLKYEGLTPETAYSLVITKRATAESFKSSIVQTITTKRAIAKSDTLLVPASESSYARAISYDISSLLDGAKITDVSEENDDAGILTSRNWTNTVVRLGFLSASVGQSATVEVEAQLPDDGDYLVITLALRAVDVMAEGEDGTYWVRDKLSGDEVTSVDAALGDLPDGSRRLDAFGLSPCNSVGGSAVTNAASAKATWEFSKDIETTGTFDVYCIEKGTATKLDGVTRTDTGITFDVQGAFARYAVVYTSPKPQTFQVTAAQAQNGSIETSVQEASANDAVTVTVTPSQGFKLDTLTVTCGTDVPITPTLQSEGTYTFTMPAASVTVSATFVPITPVFSAINATYNGDENTVDVTWTLENNGAAITKYGLAVTLDGEPISGSPFLPSTTETSYKLASLEPGTYSLVLTATNNDATATSKAVTVTVPEPEALTYTVALEPTENGSFSLSHSTAEAGTTVTITPDPNEGYETASVMVKDANGEVVTATSNEGGTYAFEMPSSNVTVSGTFEKVADDDEPAEDDLNALLEKTFEENDDFEAVMLTKGTYRLTDDLSIADLKKENGRTSLKTTSLYIGNDADGATVELDLQGHTLDAEDCALIVTEGSTLNLTDSVGGGSISGRKGLSYTDTTTGTKYAYAGGIAVYGTLNMSGGSITGNQAAGEGVLGYGGGVYVFGGGTFNMYGGTISGNTASTRGGGVAVRSATDATPVPNPLYVGGAQITEWNEVDGGDVDAELSIGLLGSRVGEAAGSYAGTFNLYGGAITGNSAPVAGGVYAGGSVTIGTDGTTPAAVSVTGNTSGNLYVPAGVTVELSATPAAGSKVGVTMEKAPGLFATANNDVASSSRASFTSDSGAYYVTTQQDGLALANVPMVPTYEPEIEVPGGGGTVTTDPRYPEQGDEVTIKPEPDEGKTVGTVEVTDKDGESVKVTNNGDGTWTYRQPAGSVTITVTFVCDGGELCPSAHLVDVDQSKWYHLAIDWAVTNGVMSGYGDGVTFGPDDVLNRAQMAGVLYNLADQPEADVSALPDDCASYAWYAACVAWSLETGVFNGYGDGSAFGPDDPLTREQAAAVLMNAASLAGLDTSARADLSAYPDACEVSDWAREALSWAVAEDVLHGVDVGDGTRELQPGRACSRSEMAALMMNLATRG